MSLSDREVWIVFPRSERTRIASVRKALRRECRARSWRLQEVVPNPERRIDGRPLMWMAGADAVKLYRRSHRTRVGVFHTGSPRVRLMRGARISMAVEMFVRYKAYASPLPDVAAQVSQYLDEYETWCHLVACENIHDPRCLPFHVFESHQTELGTPEQRRRFGEVHGAGNRRRDHQGLTWCLNPAAFHGRDALHVAGCELPRGAHWDVSADGRDAPTVATPTEQWRIRRKSGYVNVYPDGHVMGRKPYAQRL